MRPPNLLQDFYLRGPASCRQTPDMMFGLRLFSLASAVTKVLCSFGSGNLRKTFNERSTNMRVRARISGIAIGSLTVLIVTTFGVPIVQGQAQHVRWDIINLVLPPPNPLLPTFTAGGVAYATARNGGEPTGQKIKLTGSGTFEALASGGQSITVTGGGTWETFRH